MTEVIQVLVNAIFNSGQICPLFTFEKDEIGMNWI